MRILLTGATGFLGSHLCIALINRGHQVCILKRSTSNTVRIGSLLSEIEAHDADLVGINDALAPHRQVDLVVHLATCYGRKGETVSQVFECNTVFPLQVLEVAARRGLPFINADSVLPNELSAYALSKGQFREWGKHLVRSANGRFVNIRSDHFYGAGDDPTKFTTHVFRACIDGVKEIDLTNGWQRRDFIHVDDVVHAYIAIIEQCATSVVGFSEFGIGTGTTTQVRDFVELVRHLAGSNAKLNFGAIPYRLREPMECPLDISRTLTIGWRPTIELGEGIRMTLASERGYIAR